ncbi:MAG: hypothetical protein K0R09_2577 [Clostridiales bacterium]|nr:hypothetical protein [Clostridiales bacterium]
MNTILAVLNSKYVHSSLALRYIKAYCKEYDIEIYESTINENLLDNALKLIEKNPDIIGFSCYIWNMESTLKLCSVIKEAKPEVRIILGGPEVSYDADIVLGNYSYIDYIITGEGEVPFRSLLDAINNDLNGLYQIDGLVYRKDGEVISNGQCKVIEDLNIIPFPYADEIPDRIIYYEASRGCPFNCSYCLSSTLRGIRHFNIERIKMELKYFIDKNVKLVKFVDRTFNANKKIAMEIWKFLIFNSKNTLFHFEIAGDLLDAEEINLLKSAPKGLFQFEIGVQTTNPEILKNINRIMDFNKVKNNVMSLIAGDNIHCHLDLIAGLPGENMASYRRSFDMCMKIEPDVLQLGFLKVLKGSPIYSQRSKYDIHHISFTPYQVLYTRDMSISEMTRLLKLEEAFESYYNSGIYKITMKYILKLVNSTFDFFMEFTEYLIGGGFFVKHYDLKDRFKFLYDYLKDKYDVDIIKDLLLHDFIIGTKKSWLPDFLKGEYTDEIKIRVNESWNQVKEMLGEVNPKKIVYVQVKTKVKLCGNNYNIEKSDSIVIFDLQNSKFCYI